MRGAPRGDRAQCRGAEERGRKEKGRRRKEGRRDGGGGRTEGRRVREGWWSLGGAPGPGGVERAGGPTGGGWPPPPWLPSEKSVWTTGSPRPPFLNPLPNPRLHRAPRSRPGGRAGPPRRPRPRFSAVRDKAGLFCLGSLWLSSSPSGPALLRPLRDGAFAPREARRAPGLGRGRRAPGLGRGHPRRAEAEGLLSPWLALAFLRPLRAGFPSPPQGRRLRSARGPPRPWAGQRTPRPWAGQGRTEAGRGGRPRAPAPNAGGRRRGPATHLQRNPRQSLKGKTRLPLLTLA